jgi:uncharacterized membrane protein
MSPRVLKIVCAVSLLFNIFLIAGLVAGAARLHGKRGMMAAGTFRIAGAELPEAERNAFRQQMHDARLQVRPIILQGKQARADAAALLRAPALDQAALTAALDRARTADIAVRTQMETRAVAFAATLPQADRAKLADGLERRGNGRRR